MFVPDFNRRFTVAPAQRPSAFTPVPKGMDLSLLLSIEHDRRVRNDNTVIFRNLILQLSSTRSRLHFVKCYGQGRQQDRGRRGREQPGLLGYDCARSARL